MTLEPDADAEGLYWAQLREKRWPATLSLAPGRSVYGELVLKGKGKEFRVWDPFRSKLSAALLKGLELMPIRKGSRVLYLGASTGTTVSHVSDIVGDGGFVFAVELAHRVARELLENVVRYRKNVVPIIEDARNVDAYKVVYGRVDVVYCDIAQPDQTSIALINCRRYLKKGHLLLVVKARSIDSTRDPSQIVQEEAQKVREGGLEVLQTMELDPFDKDHGMILAVTR
ncbi:MAG: fibrillarin-like rRNA/tRNA 2'-O-methyltransferase [Conexivisphaerales archaeon]|jgi:fibrillarin-like pre-rRNA processing protein